ncbi:MAG: YbaB/EbfC family nucleoid-associated protein [Clostridia bacterium]|nr:YbaB/EbfC family nucleoid-associated protein [Clostridia bacterium]MBR3460840.1 YbaB/EbfC family nucleoid-associated protein [Clostridia bacterium]
MAKGFMPGMGGNMQQLMKQAQKMQQDVQRIQEEVGNRELEYSAGGGAVKVVIYGRKELKSIEIQPECVDPDDVEMLQDMILAAVNGAINLAEETMSSEMNRVTGGMNLGF